jgi:Sensors of blue-light using FAD
VLSPIKPNYHHFTSLPYREEVVRVMYASLSNVSNSVYDEMLNIREHAIRRNAADGVNVALLHQSGWFTQWMEGPASSVQALLSRVTNDARHQSLYMLHYSKGSRRLTEPWSMAVVQTHELASDFANRVQGLREEYVNNRVPDPASVWRRLSTPLSHPGATQQAQSDHFQRVMVCSAQGTESFNLVRWLGKEHDAEVVHRRFVGSSLNSPDVGTDYVDLAAGEVVRRVIAMARNGLQIGLTQAFLIDYSHVILLLSGKEERDLFLMERLKTACAYLSHRPVIVGIGPLSCDHTALQRLARSGGLVYLDCDLAGDMGPESLWAAAEQVLDQGVAANSVWPSAWPLTA